MSRRRSTFSVTQLLSAAGIGLMVPGALLADGIGGVPGLMVMGGATLTAIGAMYPARQREVAEPRAEQGWEMLQRELERARRHETPLVLARFPISPAVAGRLSDPVSEVERCIRGTDYAWVVDRSVFLLLPQVTRKQAKTCLIRVARVLWLDPVNDPRVVSFPEDALTTGALIDALQPGADRRVARTSTPRSVAKPRLVELDGEASVG